MTSIHLISVVSLALVFVFGVITLSVRFFEIDIFYNEAQPLEYIYISCFKTSLVRMTRFFKPCRSMWKGILKKMKILLVKMLVCEHTAFYWEWFLAIFVTGIKLFPLILTF